MQNNYTETDYEDLDIELLKEEVAKDPAYKNIISRIWEMIEEIDVQNKVPGRPQKNLQDLVIFFRKHQKKNIAAMHAEWLRACGKPMTIEQEELVFGSPKTKVKMAIMNMIQDYIEHIHKANEIAKLLGLESIGPITRNKQTSGWGKGGKERAEACKENKEELRAECISLHAEMKKRCPNLSPNAIDVKIAPQIGISKSYVYQLRTNRK